MAHTDLTPHTLFIPRALPGVTPDYRVRSKPREISSNTLSKQNKQTKSYSHGITIVIERLKVGRSTNSAKGIDGDFGSEKVSIV